MSQNQDSGSDNFISRTQDSFEINQTVSTSQETEKSGFFTSAQNLFGGQTQPQNQYFKLNNTIDAAQAMMGHTGQGGPGVHGLVDQAQLAFTGHQGPVGGIQGALNTAQGLQGVHELYGAYNQSGLGSLATTAGGFISHQGQPGATQGGFINQAQGFLGYQGQPTYPIQQGSNLGGINSTIDSVQTMMGHTGQGGTGFQGYIDRAQGYFGQTGQLAGQGIPVQPTNIPDARHIPQQTGGTYGFMDTVKGYFGHTDTA